nr:endogenous retrovirus group K member 8 Pro protein-like [Dasypus novemcinctus]
MATSVPYKADIGDHIAQLLLLPYVPIEASEKVHGRNGFGSTGMTGVFLTEKVLESHPVCEITIQNKLFKGLIDTGADISIISSNHWPSAWPFQDASISIVGLGAPRGLKQSVQIFHCLGPGGQHATLELYVADLLINLWGCDLLEQWQAEIYIPQVNQYSKQSQQLMRKQEHVPGLGLGKHHQGIVEPIDPMAHGNHGGFRYSPFP